jgi:hypothetical protein
MIGNYKLKKKKKKKKEEEKEKEEYILQFPIEDAVQKL